MTFMLLRFEQKSQKSITFLTFYKDYVAFVSMLSSCDNNKNNNHHLYFVNNILHIETQREQKYKTEIQNEKVSASQFHYAVHKIDPDGYSARRTFKRITYRLLLYENSSYRFINRRHKP